MSKLFHANSDGSEEEQQEQLPLLSELVPEIEAEANRLEAMALPQLATEILQKAFKAEYEPGSGIMEIGGVIDVFLPPHGEFNGPVWKIPEPSEAEYRLRDLIREGVQALEHASLLMPEGYSTNGNWYHAGYVTTRLARAALADGSAERIVSAARPR